MDPKEIQEKQEKERGVNVFFDMESLRMPSGKLIPNLIVVQDEFGVEWVFEGLDATEKFCEREEGEL